MNVSTDELVSLVKGNLHEDMILEGQYFYSKIGGLYAFIDSKSEHHDMITLNKDRYDMLVAKANETGDIPLYICSTPVGIWEFNLDIIKPEMDKSVVYLKIDRGNPILPWYPDFPSEAEWITDSLNEYSDNPDNTHELELLIQEMIDSEVDFDKEFDPNAE